MLGTVPVQQLYLYDLPKEKLTSNKIQEAFKDKGFDLDGQPQIIRKLNAPFFSAIVKIKELPEKKKNFKTACEEMRYF